MKHIKIETVKTVIIAVLITAIIAFIGGIEYEKSVTTQVHAAAAELTASK